MVINLLQYSITISIAGKVLKAAVETGSLNFYVNCIYEIQLRSEIVYYTEEEKRKEIAMYTSMKKVEQI